jgi:thiamine biosynthesis protein ThiS
MTEVADTEAVGGAEPTLPAHGTMQVTVNGERRALPAGTTLADLLRAHDLDPRLVVVERNRAILRDRASFASLALDDGDVLELVHFVGGG